MLRRLDLAERLGAQKIPLSVRGAVADATGPAEEAPSAARRRGVIPGR
jgi:hypothetical protein